MLSVGVSAIIAGSGVTSRTTGGVNTQATKSTFIIGAWGFRETKTVDSVTDNQGNTYTEIGTAQLWSSGTRQLRWWRCEDGVGGTGHTATVTISASDELIVCFLELKSDATYPTLEDDDGTVDTSSPYDSPSITTSGTDRLLVSQAACNSGSNPVTVAESTGFTIQVSETNGSLYWAGAIATDTAATAGSYNSSWTFSGASSTGVQIAAFREAAAAGTLGALAWIKA